jgi:hypothetical protein
LAVQEGNEKEQVIKELEKQIRLTESVNSGWVYLTIEKAKKALELLKEQEQKCGRWERITGMAPPEYHGHRICSICECFAPYDPLHMGREILPKYCPGCGAKMEGEA